MKRRIFAQGICAALVAFAPLTQFKAQVLAAQHPQDCNCARCVKP